MINLILLDRSYQFEHKPQSAQEIISKVIAVTGENNLAFSHFVVDDVAVYDNYAEFLAENIQTISTVIAEVKTPDEMLTEIIHSAYTYLERGIPALEHLARGFYQGAAKEAWLGFEQMLEGLQWINQVVYQMEQNKAADQRLDKLEEFDLKSLLADLEQAVENKDTVLIADILNYELLPRYNGLRNLLAAILDIEVMPSGAN